MQSNLQEKLYMGQIYTHVQVGTGTSVENQKSTKWPEPHNKQVAYVYCWVRLFSYMIITFHGITICMSPDNQDIYQDDKALMK